MTSRARLAAVAAAVVAAFFLPTHATVPPDPVIEAKLDFLETKADALEAKLDQLGVESGQQIVADEALEAKLDAIEAKLDAIEAKLDFPVASSIPPMGMLVLAILILASGTIVLWRRVSLRPGL